MFQVTVCEMWNNAVNRSRCFRVWNSLFFGNLCLHGVTAQQTTIRTVHHRQILTAYPHSMLVLCYDSLQRPLVYSLRVKINMNLFCNYAPQNEGALWWIAVTPRIISPGIRLFCIVLDWTNVVCSNTVALHMM